MCDNGPDGLAAPRTLLLEGLRGHTLYRTIFPLFFTREFTRAAATANLTTTHFPQVPSGRLAGPLLSPVQALALGASIRLHMCQYVNTFKLTYICVLCVPMTGDSLLMCPSLSACFHNDALGLARCPLLPVQWETVKWNFPSTHPPLCSSQLWLLFPHLPYPALSIPCRF